MAHDEPAQHRQFLDAITEALPEAGEAWQFRTLADGTALVGRLELDESTVVVLIDVRSLDTAVTAAHVAQVADLGTQVGMSVLHEGPAAFICSRHTPSDDAVLAADLRKVRILRVHATGEGSWGYVGASVSHQEFAQPPTAPARSEPQWLAIHRGSDRALFYAADRTRIASFTGLCATLVWQDQTRDGWDVRRIELPAGTVMAVPDQPPIPVTGVILQFHQETRPLRAEREPQAYAELITTWLWS